MMMPSLPFVFLSMIFMHVLDDYVLQGVLAQMKQRSWWVENAPDPLYKNDYLMALWMHSLSWSFMIMLPLALYTYCDVGILFVIGFIVNAAIHFIVDDLKANKHCINLWQDQVVHLIQIAITFAVVLNGGSWL